MKLKPPTEPQAQKPMAHKIWLEKTVAMAHAQGYRVTPVFEDGKTMPYAAGQSYPDTDALCWKNAIAIGVVLDDVILVDWDGNKAAVIGAEITALADLAAHLGLSQMPDATQKNSAGDSLHFLFRLASNADPLMYRQSRNGYLPHIDLKRGNQLMHLKPHKIITNQTLPHLSDLPEASPALVEALSRDNPTSHAMRYQQTFWSGDRWEVDEAHAILRYIEPAEDYEPWLDVLMRIHDKFGATEEALEIADTWSGHADNYSGPDEVAIKLASFGPGDCLGQPRRSWGALCARARQNGADLAAIREIYGDLEGDSL